jgi:hypothetical protein
MKLRLGSLCILLTLTVAFASDGIPPRGSAEDYPAHQVSGKIAIGAAYVIPAQAKKLFGEDLDKRGYVVFEVGIFPVGDTEAEVSPDAFKLKGKDGSIARASTPHMVAGDMHPQRTPDTGIPGNVHVQTAETVGYGTSPYGHGGVYTASTVAVSNYPPPQAPYPTQSAGNDKLEQQVEEKSLPDIKTKRAVAGYVFFPKPSGDKHADYELLYLGTDGQVSLKFSPTR